MCLFVRACCIVSYFAAVVSLVEAAGIVDTSVSQVRPPVGQLGQVAQVKVGNTGSPFSSPVVRTGILQPAPALKNEVNPFSPPATTTNQENGKQKVPELPANDRPVEATVNQISNAFKQIDSLKLSNMKLPSLNLFGGGMPQASGSDRQSPQDLLGSNGRSQYGSSFGSQYDSADDFGSFGGLGVKAPSQTQRVTSWGDRPAIGNSWPGTSMDNSGFVLPRTGSGVVISPGAIGLSSGTGTKAGKGVTIGPLTSSSGAAPVTANSRSGSANTG